MHRLIGQVSCCALLLQIDEDLAEEVAQTVCPRCGGPLHVANYPRALRGGLPGRPEGCGKRFRFCCGRQGCRGRVTAVSVRLFGRRWYVAPVMVLVSAFQHGATPRRLDRIQKWLERPVPRSTLERWRRWWREPFTASPFWQGLRGRFAEPVAGRRLPLSLIEIGPDREQEPRQIE